MSSSSTNRDSVAVLIPARFASSRFPGKPLTKILGIPLVVRVYQRVIEAIPRENVFVATDDARIRSVCHREDIQVIMTSDQCATGTDRICEAVKNLNAKIIINVQGDEPLIHANDILTVVRAKLERPSHVVNAMCKIEEPQDIQNPNVPKVVVNDQNELLYISRSPIPFVQKKGMKALYRRQVCIYAFTKEELAAFSKYGKKSPLELAEDIEIIRFFSLGIPVYMTEVSNSSVAVDVPEDIARVEAILRSGSKS